MLSSTRVPLRRTSLGVMVALAVLAGMLTGVSQAQTEDADLIVINDVQPSNEQITTRLSRLTVDSARTAIVASSDNRSYADSLASAGLQDLGPLLLLDDVQPGRNLPDAVLTELLRLEVSRVLILGGEAAVSISTQDAIERAGYEVQRIAGPSRVETAIEVARVGAPDADVALLVRAFGTNEVADPTQGWVDALSSGPLAIENDAPILLSQQEQLTPATAAYLAESNITDVVIIGGTAAVSSTVETQLLGLGYAVFRIAGSDRVETALSVNDARGVLDNPQRSIIVDGFADNGWVGGFASARHAAETRAAILPAQGDELTPGVRAVIAANPVYSARPVTCIVAITACQEVNPDLRPDEPVDTSTDTPTAPPEPVTDAVVVRTIPQSGSVLSPYVGLNEDVLLSEAELYCDVEEGLAPGTEDFSACVSNRFEEALAAPLPPIDGTPPFVAIEVQLDDPLVELQNQAEITGDCLSGTAVAIPYSVARVGVIDERPAFYLELQETLVPGTVETALEESPLGADPSGPCVLTVTSPLVANPDGEEGEPTEFLQEVPFLLDAALANFRIATIPNLAPGQVSFENDSWGLDQQLSWDFGDGSTFPAEGGSIPGERWDAVVHTYDSPGEYEVTLTITTAGRGADGQPNQTSISRIVKVD